MKKEKVFFVLTIFTALLGGFLLVYPFLRYLVFALLLTYLLYPFKRWLEGKIRSRHLAMLILSLTIIVAIVLPSVYITSKLMHEVRTAVSSVTDSPDRQQWLFRIEGKVQQVLGKYVDLSLYKEQLITQVKDVLLGAVSGFLGSLSDALIGLLIMFFVMAYLFKTGEGVFDRVRLLIPLDPNLKDKLIDEIRNVTSAVVYGQVMTAVAQGSLGGLGFLLFGVANAIFWGFVMVILSFLPLLGAAIIWVPAGIYLILSGETLRGVGLLVYSAVVVSSIDNILKPRLISGKSKIHPVTVMLGVFGGLKLFGFIGLFAGPLILALLIALLRFYEEEYLSPEASGHQ